MMAAMAAIGSMATLATGDSLTVGPYYTDCPNGIAFIEGGKQVGLLRVGWIVDGKYESDYGAMVGERRELHYGLSAPDGSYQELSWKVGEATITLRWGYDAAGIIAGEIRTDRPLRLVLELGGEQPACTTSALSSSSPSANQGVLEYHPNSGLQLSLVAGVRQEPSAAAVVSCGAASHEALASLITGPHAERPAAPDKTAALAYDLAAGQTLGFTCLYGDKAAPVKRRGFDLDKARAKTIENALTAGGAWDDFLGPISYCMHFSRVFSQDNKMIAHTVSRGWCRPDGQVLFGWDSFFNGLLSCLDDPEGAKETVRAVLAAATPEGFVANFSGRTWGRSDDRSQPPVGAMCVWKMHQRHPDKAFLAEVYPKLVKWHEWWFSPHKGTGKPNRDGNSDGLLEWGSETGVTQDARFESGLDDSPMFDDATMSGPNMRMDSVDLSSLWAMDAEYLGYIADALGKRAEAKAFRKERDDMAKRIDSLMWNDELGIYCNRYWEPVPKTDPTAPPQWFSTRLTPCNFYPMIAGIPSKEKAERMLKLLRDPNKFWGEFVCPTITRDDPAFKDQNYWRGKVWAPTNYLMWLGLKRYASPELLNEFAEKSVALFMRNWRKDGTCHENFMANGDGSSDPHYTWGALLCLIGLEALCDVEPDGKVRLSGAGKGEVDLRRIPIGGKLYEVVAGPSGTVLYLERGHKEVARGGADGRNWGGRQGADDDLP
jgi:hypothetical protein